MGRSMIVWSSLVLAALAGCHAYRMEPPPGFAVVTESNSFKRMKAGDNVGANVKVFNNVEGGTLAFWSEDLVHKLAMRRYTLIDSKPTRSSNGKPGMRFDFEYVTSDEASKFYSVVLFVTKKHRTVIELAGDQALWDHYAPRMGDIATSIKIRGKASNEQPKNLMLVAPESPAKASEPPPKASKPEPPTDDEVSTPEPTPTEPG